MEKMAGLIEELYKCNQSDYCYNIGKLQNSSRTTMYITFIDWVRRRSGEVEKRKYTNEKAVYNLMEWLDNYSDYFELKGEIAYYYFSSEELMVRIGWLSDAS